MEDSRRPPWIIPPPASKYFDIQVRRSCRHGKKPVYHREKEYPAKRS
jgi:hypothetical protein